MVGLIELNANPHQSKVLCTSVFRVLDFKTIDKRCKMNKEFEKFIEQTEKRMTASIKYVFGAEKEPDEFFDAYFANDTKVENHGSLTSEAPCDGRLSRTVL